MTPAVGGDAGADLGADAGAAAAGLPSEVEAGAAEVEETSSGLETELMDIAESEAGVDQVNERVEDGFEVVETMESYREALAIATESGGLDRHGARMFQIGLEACYQRLDMMMPQVMSLESFGGASKKISATQLSLESLGEQIKKIWEKIYQAIMHGIQLGQQFSEKIFNGAVRLEEQAKSVMAKAKAIQGQPSTREITDAGLIESLFVPGGNPMNALNDVLKTASGLYAAYPSMVGHAAKTIAQFKQPDGSTSLAGSAVYPWTPELIQGVAPRKAQGDNGGMVYESNVLPGGKVLAFNISQNAGQCSAELDHDEQQVGNAKLPVLSPPQAGQICDMVLKLAGQVKQSKAAVAKSIEAQKQLAEIAKAFMSINQQDPQAGERNDLEAKREGVLAIKKALEEPFKSFNVYALQTGAAALKWVNASAAAYSAQAQSGAPAKPAAPAAGQAPAKA